MTLEHRNGDLWIRATFYTLNYTSYSAETLLRTFVP